jgi:D-alanyl-D-alanine carboxypeptidase/D-alanyl-D-alanine-endopeptidase (penicillin-binding protein 4)
MTRLLWVTSRLCAVLLVLATSACSADAAVPRSASDSAVRAVPPPIAHSVPSPERPEPVAPPASTCKKRPRKERATGAPLFRGIDRVIGTHSVGVAVGARGRLLYGHLAGRPRVPASNQKLLLSMALLDVLGPGYRIPTKAAAQRVNGASVEGDLWVIGAGDPTLSARSPGYWGGVTAATLEDLAVRIVRSGIKDVQGRIVGARGYFAHDLRAPGWQSYVPGRYVQLPSALAVDGNNSGRPDPERAAAAALTLELRRLGVSVAGKPASGDPPKGLTNLARVRSRPLADIVAHMNRTSNNFFAEMLGKLLGAKLDGPPGTIAGGARAITRWASAHGVRVTANDASGLSYENRISPRGLVRLLEVAEGRPWGNALRRGLPGAGQGTLGSRLDGVEVRAKTGTLFNGASTLSGWVRARNGRHWVAFSILGRGTPKVVEDRIVEIVSGARLPAAAPEC